MQALEFESRIEPNKEIVLPPNVREQIAPGRKVRVLILLEDEDSDDWARASVESFFSGEDGIEELYSQP